MNNNFNDLDCAVMPYQEGEIATQPYNKQYFGLAGSFSSAIGYPLQPRHFINLSTVSGEVLDFEVCSDTYQAIEQKTHRIHLDSSEFIWLWVSVDSAHGIEDWRIIKSHLPHSIMQNLYDKCHHIDHLVSLLDLTHSFKNQLVRHFAESLLYNEDLMRLWLSIPASRQHHHSFPGGLIVHSLEVAQMVKNHFFFIRNEVREIEQEVTILAALLHDIGKIRTIGIKQHTDLGWLMDHEKLTLLVLAEPLSAMESKVPKVSETLKYLLTWSSKDGFCKFIGGEMLKNADQISTKLSLRRMAFDGKPEYFQYSKLSIGGRSHFLNRL